MFLSEQAFDSKNTQVQYKSLRLWAHQADDKELAPAHYLLLPGLSHLPTAVKICTKTHYKDCSRWLTCTYLMHSPKMWMYVL